MIEFGSTLQKAREAKGMSIQQVAEATRILPQQVEDLESENFSRIAAPIYGRGFVKLYCEAVGLDPKPLIAEFMDIYNGNRQPTIRRRRPAAAPAPEPTPEPTPASVPAPAPEPVSIPQAVPVPAAPVLREEGDLPGIITAAPSVPPSEPAPSASFHLEPETIAAPAPRETEEFPAISIPPPSRGPSRYAAPTPVEPARSERSFDIPPAVWRLMALAVVAALILWGVFKLAAKVWNAATVAPPEPAAAETGADLPGAPAPDPSAPVRKPRSLLPVPPLYFD